MFQLSPRSREMYMCPGLPIGRSNAPTVAPSPRVNTTLTLGACATCWKLRPKSVERNTPPGTRLLAMVTFWPVLSRVVLTHCWGM